VTRGVSEQIPGRAYEFSSIIDDSPLKQGTYAPGTAVPVRPADSLANMGSDRPVVVVVLAWNFWDEIKSRVLVALHKSGVKEALAIVPWPEQRVVRLPIESHRLEGSGADQRSGHRKESQHHHHHHHHHGVNGSIPCVVCGSHDLQEVLDLDRQPLANDFKKTAADAEQCERYPLKLVRCRKCHHSQLSSLVDRGHLFSHYLYMSGTSKTLHEHFTWLARKVIAERSGDQTVPGTVLELACNDGTQLDVFKQRGWRTYGVDPAENLVQMAQGKGHRVHVGFWGAQAIDGLPDPAHLDAILAQNVLAHTGRPIDFLRACHDAMGASTKLYVQTSQCEMFLTGQFDTVYHEHVSFFSGHSFLQAAEAAGLTIVDIELVPIHGKSCLVTMRKGRSLSVGSKALAALLDKEVALGMTGDAFYDRYRRRALSLRRWMHSQLNDLHGRGYTLIAYGAAAKGMVLLHFLRQVCRSWRGVEEVERVVGNGWCSICWAAGLTRSIVSGESEARRSP
jgi:SAM-dependent methyltransferase